MDHVPIDQLVARNIQTQNMDESVLQAIINNRTAVDIWNALKAKFRGDSLSSQLKALQELMSFKWTI
jgi:hypothetical protein